MLTAVYSPCIHSAPKAVQEKTTRMWGVSLPIQFIHKNNRLSSSFSALASANGNEDVRLPANGNNLVWIWLTPVSCSFWYLNNTYRVQLPDSWLFVLQKLKLPDQGWHKETKSPRTAKICFRWVEIEETKTGTIKNANVRQRILHTRLDVSQEILMQPKTCTCFPTRKCASINRISPAYYRHSPLWR